MKNSVLIKRCWKPFAEKMVHSIIYRGCLLIMPILFGITVDRITDGKYDEAVKFAIFLFIVAVVYKIEDIVNTYVWHKLYNKMYKTLTKEALDNTYRNSLFSLSRFSISEYINIMGADIDAICCFFCDLSVRICRILEFLIIFGYLFKVDFKIGLASLISSLLVLFVLIKSSKTIEKLNHVRTVSHDKKTNSIHELLLSIKEIKTLNVFSPIKNNILKITDEYVVDLLKQRTVEDGFRYGNALIIEICRFGLLLFGIYLISKGQMLIGTLTVIYNYFGQISDNMSEISVINNKLRNLNVSNKRYNKIFQYSQDLDETDIKINEDPKGEVVFENILYGYRNDPTLKDVSFKIKPNTINTIVGSAGCGRNGIFDLLLKLNRQHEGNIKLDNFDIKNYSNKEYFDLVSSVFKEPLFFQMSIRDNLSIIDDNFENIKKVCEKLHIDEYIEDLKEGYDTIIDNEAHNIQSNIKYLLGIARILLKGSKVMLFDETFSTFDRDTKDDLMELLKNLSKTHTIIIITKDEELLKFSDQILLIDNNRLLKAGTHKRLLLNNVYRNIIR
jgi:ABC-type multidrug transport system, ATPase and permease components